MHLQTTNNTEPIRTVSYTYTTSIKTMNKILAKNRTQARRPLCICEMTPRKPKTKRTKFKRITYGSRYYFQILKRLLFKMKKKKKNNNRWHLRNRHDRDSQCNHHELQLLDHYTMRWSLFGKLNYVWPQLNRLGTKHWACTAISNAPYRHDKT